MPVLGCSGDIRRKGGLNYTCQEKNELCQGLQVACMMHLTCWALPYCSPQSDKQQLPRRRGETASDPAVLKGGLHMKFLCTAGKYLLDWLAWGGYSVSTFNSEMGAAGPLDVLLLQNPSSGLRGMAACWDWAFGFPSIPPLPHFFLKMKWPNYWVKSPKQIPRGSLGTLPE